MADSAAQSGSDPQLFVVDANEIAQILALPLPAHPETIFDEAQFKDLVARSFSITLDEKKEIIASCPKFSQHQIDELFRILGEERVKFAELNAKHVARMSELETKHAAEWQEHEQQSSEEQKAREDDEKKAEEIRKQMGL